MIQVREDAHVMFFVIFYIRLKFLAYLHNLHAECLNLSLLNLVCISWQLSPSQWQTS
jgi:hypothetical protein